MLTACTILKKIVALYSQKRHANQVGMNAGYSKFVFYSGIDEPRTIGKDNCFKSFVIAALLPEASDLYQKSPRPSYNTQRTMFRV